MTDESNELHLARQQRDQLRAALAGLVGAESDDELRAMEGFIRSASEVRRANAIFDRFAPTSATAAQRVREVLARIGRMPDPAERAFQYDRLEREEAALQERQREAEENLRRVTSKVKEQTMQESLAIQEMIEVMTSNYRIRRLWEMLSPAKQEILAREATSSRRELMMKALRDIATESGKRTQMWEFNKLIGIAREYQEGEPAPRPRVNVGFDAKITLRRRLDGTFVDPSGQVVQVDNDEWMPITPEGVNRILAGSVTLSNADDRFYPNEPKSRQNKGVMVIQRQPESLRTDDAREARGDDEAWEALPQEEARAERSW